MWILFILSLFYLPLYSQTYEKEISIVSPECLKLIGQSRSGSRYELKFYNMCPEKRNAVICVEERPGKFKLHRSARKIPSFGYLSIFTYDGTPGSVQWKSSPGSPNLVCGTS